jgi:hypothetical protein
MFAGWPITFREARNASLSASETPFNGKVQDMDIGSVPYLVYECVQRRRCAQARD